MVRSKALSRSAAVVAAIFVASSTGQPAAGTPISYGSNYYDFVPSVGISWADANAHAATMTIDAEKSLNMILNS